MERIDAIELELAARKMVQNTSIRWPEVIKFRGCIYKALENL